jgi:hypothetical protein
VSPIQDPTRACPLPQLSLKDYKSNIMNTDCSEMYKCFSSVALLLSLAFNLLKSEAQLGGYVSPIDV